MATASPLHPRTANDPDFLRQVAALRQPDNFTNWFYLAREYLLLAVPIAATIFLYEQAPLWAAPVILLTIIWVGAGQHRLATLTHEAAHYVLFRNRLLNELVSELCCMFPMLGTTH